MDLKHLVDASSYLLMEDSADSEADIVQSEVTAIGGGGGDDDAESCCCDTDEVSVSHADDCNDRDPIDQWKDLSQRSSLVWASDREHGRVLMDVNEEEESWVDSSGESGGGGLSKEGGGGLSKEEMNALEDKVFWETCMAIGYP